MGVSNTPWLLPRGNPHNRAICCLTFSMLEKCREGQAYPFLLLYAGLLQAKIFAEVCSCWNSSGILQWISQQPMMLQPHLNFLNTSTVADEAFFDINSDPGYGKDV